METYFSETDIKSEMTAHSQLRMRQRGIKNEMLLIAVAYGEHLTTHAGAEQLFISKRAANDMLADGYPSATIERTKGLVVVIQNGRILTVYKKTSRRGSRSSTRRQVQ